MLTPNQMDHALEELSTKVDSLNQQYEQTRKLITDQAVAIDRKIIRMEQYIDKFLNRKPDPAMIRDAWIRQIPKIREDLRNISLDVAQMKAKTTKGAENDHSDHKRTGSA